MSIRDDQKFMHLLGKYSFRLIDISELIDYIDEYVRLQIHLKEINQRTEKALEVKND